MKAEEISRLLRTRLQGELHTDIATRLMYATDASVYREIPEAVAYPHDKDDLKQLIQFAQEYALPLTMRTAGTSLAGQVVGSGIIADVSRYMNRILEIDPVQRWVRLEPGVVADELNMALKPYGLFFAPETSTSNRCMIGGMIGNNSCGAHSLIYGSTRDHLLELECLLSDGSEVRFSALSPEEFEQKLGSDGLEGKIYRHISGLLKDEEIRHEIGQQYPDPRLHRRNTGYALDLLARMSPFTAGGPAFNLCSLLAGSEGTLAITVSTKLQLLPLPPPVTGLLCVHFSSLDEAIKANLTALKYHPGSIELMDQVILDCTRDNLSQKGNRFFIEGEPAAILMIEWARDTKSEIEQLAEALISELLSAGSGYHYPLIFGPDQKKVWNLRKAGLGVLTNIPGDAKPTGLIEDTAVLPELLPDYIREFREMLKKHDASCVYYAHIATGELHMKPVLNLKKMEDHERFSRIAWDTARLVKKYRGSLSGEHGDGRLRAAFLPFMLGDKIFSALVELRRVWDPAGILNPGKITGTIPPDSSLRFQAQHPEGPSQTFFDFSSTLGWLRAVEQCNGSADCRKSARIGGVMCPTFMATSEESKSTRARANLLRECLTYASADELYTRMDLYDVLDLCLSCKGCKSECPSGIDMTKYKAEYLQHYYDHHGLPLRTRLIAGISGIYRLFYPVRKLFNALIRTQWLMAPLKHLSGIAVQRSMPRFAHSSLTRWARKHQTDGQGPALWLLADEFTNYLDAETGIAAVELLTALGYRVHVTPLTVSGRALLSKGLLRKARNMAEKNIMNLMLEVGPDQPLIGTEPSAILCFRDEYPELARAAFREAAKELGRHCFTFEEFLAREFREGRIDRSRFKASDVPVLFHGHCYQKALTGTGDTKLCLEIPQGNEVREIPSGCCGMAGSFGYEKEHYELSQKIGEMILFPEIREAVDAVIVAAGHSCRHHILDGTGRKALHPAQFLNNALVNQE